MAKSIAERYSDAINGRHGVSNHQRLDCVYSTVCSGADQRKYQSSASLNFVRGIQPVNSPHKGSVTRKLLPFDDVIMRWPATQARASVAMALAYLSLNVPVLKALTF